MHTFLKVKRALLSVSDKTNIVDLAKVLVAQDCEIISTGGTQAVLHQAGIATIDISSLTGNPEAFGGRVKTLSFQIAAALLYDRNKDQEEANQLDIAPIDLVVCNLYPFDQVLAKGGTGQELINTIDIGGCTMIRAAAKNFEGVGVITSPQDYARAIQELETHQGQLSYAYRLEMMQKAFHHTADYDALIATAMDKQTDKDSMRLAFGAGEVLRYGENSHQAAKWYTERGNASSLGNLEVLHGKALSFNNLLDINGALEAIKDCKQTACAVIKHSNPCGMAEGREQAAVFRLAWEGDPISAFGSIIAFNRQLTLETVQFLDLNHEQKAKRKFVEVIIAPDFEPAALAYLQQHKNLRIIQFDVTQLKQQKRDIRYLNGILLVQDMDNQLYQKLEIVTQKPMDLNTSKPLIEFGLQAIRIIKSNAIAIVRQTAQGNLQLLGMGAGQPNRLIATQLAIEKSKQNLANEYKGTNLESYQKEVLAQSWLISDAFFPFADNIELAADAGICQIVQPGGSIRDKAVVAACDALGITMVMTGTRHFKH